MNEWNAFFENFVNDLILVPGVAGQWNFNISYCTCLSNLVAIYRKWNVKNGTYAHQTHFPESTIYVFQILKINTYSISAQTYLETKQYII